MPPEVAHGHLYTRVDSMRGHGAGNDSRIIVRGGVDERRHLGGLRSIVGKRSQDTPESFRVGDAPIRPELFPC